MSARDELPFDRDVTAATPSFDATFAHIQRIQLDATSWVDYVDTWIQSPDAFFDLVVAARDWKQRKRWMYEREVDEPRLTAPWSLASEIPLDPPLVEAMRTSLSARYGVRFDTVGFNLYRDGRDSVAWHRDHIRRDIAQPTIALVGLGERRKFLLRPHGGGKSIAFALGGGALLVTGGRTNREWEHSVPKVARAAPRISLAFRHGMDERAYGGGGEAQD